MAKLIETPTILRAAGNVPKQIEEFVGRVNTGTSQASIARMTSPQGWEEPGQTPEFDEFTVVLTGLLVAETRGATHRVKAGQALHIGAGEWVRYSTPEAGGATYIAVCVPAFSPDAVHRDH
jgi:quercetin dioxygenase-like cupin family protein